MIVGFGLTSLCDRHTEKDGPTSGGRGGRGGGAGRGKGRDTKQKPPPSGAEGDAGSPKTKK